MFARKRRINKDNWTQEQIELHAKLADRVNSFTYGQVQLAQNLFYGGLYSKIAKGSTPRDRLLSELERAVDDYYHDSRALQKLSGDIDYVNQRDWWTTKRPRPWMGDNWNFAILDDWTQEQIDLHLELLKIVEGFNSEQIRITLVQFYRKSWFRLNYPPREQLLNELERAIDHLHYDTQLIAKLSGCIYFVARQRQS